MSQIVSDGETSVPPAPLNGAAEAGRMVAPRPLRIRTTVLTLILGLYLVHLLLLWKPLDRWIAFGEDFATSPSMAGIAAVIAATIGSRALKRQLDHTRAEATRTRRKDAEASWWEKFEWVTDRILPKDEGQKMLEKPLALALSTSLLKMSTADFQREAVRGVIDHYLSPDKENKPHGTGVTSETTSMPTNDPKSDFVYALQEYVKAARDTPGGSGVASGVLKDTLYEIQVKEALSSLLSFADGESAQRFGHGKSPLGIITIGNHELCVETKAWSAIESAQVYQMANAAAGWKHATTLDTVVITSAEVPVQWRSRNQVLTERWGDSLRIVQWLPEEGPEVLVSRIRESYPNAKK